jgi:hypothetical protein
MKAECPQPAPELRVQMALIERHRFPSSLLEEIGDVRSASIL